MIVRRPYGDANSALDALLGATGIPGLSTLFAQPVNPQDQMLTQLMVQEQQQAQQQQQTMMYLLAAGGIGIAVVFLLKK